MGGGDECTGACWTEERADAYWADVAAHGDHSVRLEGFQDSLIKARARPNVTAFDKTALGWAQENNHPACAALLEARLQAARGPCMPG